MPKLKTESAEPKTAGDMAAGGNARAMLYSYVQRIERLAEEKAALGADITEVFGEAKGTGFDTKIIRQVLRRRGMDASTRHEADAMLDLYETTIEAAEAAELAQSEKDAG